MESKTESMMEQIEQKLSGWEKWLFASFSAAIIILIHALIKATENAMLTDLLFSLGETTIVPSNTYYGYQQYVSSVHLSPERYWLWFFVELAAIVPAAILAFHSTWRKVASIRRLDLIIGYMLAGWVAYLALGAQDPLNVGNGYNVFALVWVLSLGFGYWWHRRKKDKAEEVFP